VRAPLGNVDAVDDIRAEDAERPPFRVADVARGRRSHEDLVAEIGVVRGDLPDLVDQCTPRVADRELEPRLALLAEAGRHAVTSPDMLVPDGDLEAGPDTQRARDAQAERVTQELLSPRLQPERHAALVEPGGAGPRVGELGREREVDAREPVRAHRAGCS